MKKHTHASPAAQTNTTSQDGYIYPNRHEELETLANHINAYPPFAQLPPDSKAAFLDELKTIVLSGGG